MKPTSDIDAKVSNVTAPGTIIVLSVGGGAALFVFRPRFKFLPYFNNFMTVY